MGVSTKAAQQTTGVNNGPFELKMNGYPYVYIDPLITIFFKAKTKTVWGKIFKNSDDLVWNEQNRNTLSLF